MDHPSSFSSRFFEKRKSERRLPPLNPFSASLTTTPSSPLSGLPLSPDDTTEGHATPPLTRSGSSTPSSPVLTPPPHHHRASSSGNSVSFFPTYRRTSR